MADSTKNIVYNITINDKGKVKIDNLTKSFVNADNAVNKLSADLKKQQATMAETTTKGLNPMIDKTGLAGATIVELGRTISDSNYGIRGMANNLSQLSTLMITLIMTTGNFRNGMLALKKAFMGPLGLIVLFQIAIALLERFSMEQEKAKEKTEDLTKSIDDQIRSYNLLNKAVRDYNLGGEALRDTVKLLSSEFKEFDKAFKDLADNEFKLTIFETDIFGESIKKIFEGEEAIAKLTETFTSLMENEREQILINNKLRKIQSGERAEELLAQGSALTMRSASIDTGKEEIKLEAELKELVRDKIGLRKILNDIKRVEGAKDISDLEEKIDLTYDLQEAELELKKARVAEIDEFGEDMTELDEKTKEFTDNISGMNREQLNAFQAQADGRKTILESIIDDEFFASEAIQKINEATTARKQELLFQEIEIAAFAAHAIGQALGEQSAAGKAFAIAAATMNTFVGASMALRDETLPSTFARIAMATAVIATGMAQVRQILEVDETGGGRLKGGRVGGDTSVEAPDFNVVGASPESQLAQSVSKQQTQPLRAFVVHNDIKDADELSRKVDFNRSLG